MKTKSGLDNLRAKGRKRTPQREAIFKALRASDKPMTALEVLQRVRKTQPKVSLDTVYRNLLLLVESGDLAQTHLQNRSASRFEFQKDGGHHHHAVCVGCGKSFCLPDQPEPKFVGLKEDTAIKVTGHILEFYGWCGVCRVQKT
jgi:Fe2+ or Zn2+ uptake regulation protein